MIWCCPPIAGTNSSHGKGLLITVAAGHEDDLAIQIVFHAGIQRDLGLLKQVIEQYACPSTCFESGRTGPGAIKCPHCRLSGLPPKRIESEGLDF